VDRSIVTDIVIVGGGVIGASTAFHLASRGAKVTLVDRGGIASGMTAKSGGFVQTHWDRLAEVKLIAFARDMFQHWDERVGGDCGWTQQGYLHVTGAKHEPRVRWVHQMLLDNQLESHWLDPVELAKLQPLLHTGDLVGGAYEPTSGWANPVATTRSLAAAARRHGADIREGVAVTRILHDDQRVLGVETAQCTIAAGAVILAAGPWTPSLHIGPPLPLTNERGQVMYIDRPAGLPDREIAFYDEITGLYTHPDGDTNLVGIDYPFDVIADPDDYQRELDDAYREAAFRALAHRFPRLAGATLVRGFAGLYDFTPNGQPIIDGPLGFEGYYVAAGFSGIGFKSAPATGLGLAELVLDGKPSSVDLSHLTLARFAAPPAPQFPPGLAEKLTAVRDLLSPDHQAKLMPYVMGLPPEQIAAFAVLLMTKPADEIAAALARSL
jgi:sarcosine oxidase subunit beta